MNDFMPDYAVINNVKRSDFQERSPLQADMVSA